MSDAIFQQIYEISLLNLYIYIDCALLMMMCPHQIVGFSSLGLRIDENIHRIKHEDLLSMDRVMIDKLNIEQKSEHNLAWQDQLHQNVQKIDHTYITTFSDPAIIMITRKNNNLFVTFRGTCNLHESLLDIEIFVKSHLTGLEPKVNNLTLWIDRFYEQLSNNIMTIKHIYQCDNIIFSGHSLGAILCTIFVMRLVKEKHKCLHDIKTKEFGKYFMCLLGMPSIRDEQFAIEVDRLIGKNYINICNNGDFMMKASSSFISNLNNVIQYETTQFCNIPFCIKSVHVNLGDNKLTQFYDNGLEIFIKAFGLIPSLISHSIIKYVENIYLFTKNTSKDKLKLIDKSLTDKFNDIFKNMHKILKVEKQYKSISFKGGRNKSQKKIKKTRKSKRRN
jgi:hypothetical protein